MKITKISASQKFPALWYSITAESIHQQKSTRRHGLPRLYHGKGLTSHGYQAFLSNTDAFTVIDAAGSCLAHLENGWKGECNP